MLEVLLLMLSGTVQTAAALDGPGGMPPETVIAAPQSAAESVTEAPIAVAPTPVPEPEPEPEPMQAETAPAPAPQPQAAETQSAGLALPSFPTAAPQPTPEPAPKPVFVQPAPQAEPEPAPLPVFVQPAPQAAPQPAPTETAVVPPAFLGTPATPAPQATAPQLVAEPQVPTGRFLTALEVKPILNATRANWIAVREYGGQDLLYVTHLWSWRCGLLQIKIGINGAPPEVWPMPQCHVDQPAAAAILEGDGNPYRPFGLRTVQIIEVHLTYDDLSTEAVRFNRAGVVIP